MNIFLSLLVIPLLILMIIGPLAATVYIMVVKRNRLRFVAIYSVALVVITAAEGVFIAHTFSNSIFPDTGCITTLFVPVMAAVTFVIFHRQAKQVSSSILPGSLQARWLLIGVILIPVLQLSAPVISFGYARTCDALEQKAASPIISALQQYQTDTGSYPSELKTLVPTYLASIPPSACDTPLFNLIKIDLSPSAGWSLYYCSNSPNQETYLTIRIIGSDSQQLYNLKAAHWTFGSSFDGFCGR